MPRKIILLVLILTLALPLLAAGQSVEITPFIGFRLGGELDDLDLRESFDFEESESFGIALDFALNKQAFIEVLFSRQEAALEEEGGFFGDRELFDVDIDYWHFGGLYQWNIGQVKPFIVGTLGATVFNPQPEGLDSETRFSIGFGGGAKLMFGKNFGLRFEGRGFSTFVDSDSEVFCDPVFCYGYTDTDIFWQFEGRAGLVFAF